MSRQVSQPSFVGAKDHFSVRSGLLGFSRLRQGRAVEQKKAHVKAISSE